MISVIVEDVEDIADMPIGRNAIFVEDVEDVKDKTLPGCQADILFRIELIPSFVCQVIVLITIMTFNCSSSCLMRKVSIGITINTSKCYERAKQCNDNSQFSSHK